VFVATSEHTAPNRSLGEANMIVQIDVDGRMIQFRLDRKQSRWHSMEALEEGIFPLVAIVDGLRYELYSDGTFAEVEK
jgi:hypothetical protein